MVKIIFRGSVQGILASILTIVIVTGCAVETGIIPPALYSLPETATGESAPVSVEKRAAPSTVVTATPAPPLATRLTSIKPSAQQPAKEEAADISLMFDQIALPSFIQITFGTILKKNFSVDPVVAARTDLITLRTSSLQTATQVLNTVKMLLKTYGIAVTELGGFYRIAPDSNSSAYAPEIRRGRALPEVPLPLRPVYHLVELTSVKTTDVANLLRLMFEKKINIQEDPSRAALLLSGEATDITAALEAIQVLDQPSMRGRDSRRIVPYSMSADELGRKLVDVLTAEGYAIGTTPSAGTPIMLIPISASNSLIVFAGDAAVLEHVVAWAKQLDATANTGRGSGGYFTYAVKYADAQDLAKTMQELLAAKPIVTLAPATGTTAPPAQPNNKIVVNSSTNTLIFLCSQEEYSQLRGILQTLDQPAKSALIQVTVAEVDINDSNQLGIQWTLNPIAVGNGSNILASTAGGVNLGTGGVTVNLVNSATQVLATLNALATKNRASILSSPRIMARNGETATIQVGDQVPIVTSQLSNANTVVGGSTGTTAGILQTIQYLPTGVILKVKPIIHSGNRIELEVSQEVSAASSTTTGVNTSPTISTRKVDTKLSIRDGATVLLGGLISSNDSKGNTGIPLLQDIPGLGQLFRSNTDTLQKTELVVLITPYIIDDDMVAEQVTQAFRDQLGPWARTAAGAVKPKVVAPQTAPAVGAAADATAETQRPAPTPAPAPVGAATTEDSSAMPRTAPNAAAAPWGEGSPVTDPALIEELRKALPNLGAPAANSPAQPAKQ